ncbi:MAG: hypothetical protein IJ770_01125 [Alphaproteobacteria bacterium]|nr:hypothetical protein [Alphaproteobacteria bacterium]
MKEYVSFSEDIMAAAIYKDVRLSSRLDPDNQPMRERLQNMHLTERQKEFVANLSYSDISEIYHNSGHIYPEVFIKMLENFPQEISKEVLLKYVKYCELNEEVKIKALEVLGKEAKDIILPKLHLTIELFNQILKVFSTEETKEILIAVVKGYDSYTEFDDVEHKILKVFSNDDLKDILRAFIEGSPWLCEQGFLKIFEIYPKEEVKELLEKAIERDMDIWRPTLRKIVEFFPKDEAKELIEAFWETSPGANCYTFEREEIYALLNKKK